MLPSSKNSLDPENSENCNLIVFVNVKKTYSIAIKGKPKAITVEIDVDSQVKVSTRDWVGIFPCGWTDFRQNINFEYMIGRPLNQEETKWKLMFSFTDINNELFTKSYQFVYVSHKFQILGASSHFYFISSDAPINNDVIDAPPQHKIYKQQSDTTIEFKNVKQLRHQFQDRSPRQIRGNALRPVVSDNMLYTPKLLFDMYNPECPNCYRMPDMMMKQEALYRDLKNSAALRRTLEEQVHMLQKELELSITAQTKLRIELSHERDEKDVYKTFTHSLLTKVASGNAVHITDGYNNYMVYNDEHKRQNGRNTGKGYNQLIPPQPVWHWTWVPVLTFGIPSANFITSPRQKYNEMIVQKAPTSQPLKKNGKRTVPLKNSEVPQSMLLKAYIGAQEKSLQILSEKLAKAIKKEPVQLQRACIIDLDEAAASSNKKNTTVLVTSSEEGNASENPCDLNNNNNSSDDKSIYNNDKEDGNDSYASEECNQKDN